jgi:HAD superfamily hydrolase (TIGR01509 family)
VKLKSFNLKTLIFKLNMIKLIIFDLDGVLVESKELHYEALNKALRDIDPKFVINRDEHLSTYDGLSTTNKLKLLTKNKKLPIEYYDRIWKLKQKSTWDIIKNTFTYDENIINILKELKNKEYLIYVASNSVYETIKLILLKKGFMEYIDYFISNEDVKYCKPNGEIYFKCMIRAGVSHKETMIIEDSHIGRAAVYNSGAYLLGVKDPYDYDLKKIELYINKINMENQEKQKWQGECNVVIPMAGKGSRFETAGYTFPKPLIDVNGKPMMVKK